MTTPVIELAGVRKTYNEGTAVANEVLHGISFAVPRGEFGCLIGPSGSGKSTICKRLLQDPRVVFSVSATTRKPRPGEVDGRD